MSARPDLLTYWQYFLAVVEEGSMTAAAERLGVTQSPVSQAVRRLEEIAGTRLLDRGPAGATPTAAARALLPQARVLVRDARTLAATTSRIAERAGGPQLGIVDSAPPGVIHHLVAGLGHSSGPVATPVPCRTGTAAELVAAVTSGELDLAVVEDPCPTGELRRGQLHEVPRALAGLSRRPTRWRSLSGRVLLDNTRTVSPAAADRLSDALFALGLSLPTEPWTTLPDLSARLGGGDALALVSPDLADLWPSVPAPASLALRLRCVTPQSGDDLRPLVDRLLREAVARWN
jgi:DNA-binding transcriptional LysR family regulator